MVSFKFTMITLLLMLLLSLLLLLLLFSYPFLSWYEHTDNNDPFLSKFVSHW